jgi:hypothetical protein
LAYCPLLAAPVWPEGVIVGHALYVLTQTLGLADHLIDGS